LPGMTPTSLLPKIASGAGYDFADLCEAILKRASLKVGRTGESARPQLAPPGAVTAPDAADAALTTSAG
jgi:hypothetical protein